MINEQTMGKLEQMNLYGMLKSFKDRMTRVDHKDLSFEEFFGLIVDDEYMHRQNMKLYRLLKTAKLKFSSACIEDIDYQQPRGIVKSRILALQNTQWLNDHQNILITGPTGAGKSYLACAFGQWACRNGYSVLYFRWPRLFGDILVSKGQGKYLNHLQKLAKIQLLIIDDFGMNPITDSDRKDFFEIIEDRYSCASTIISSQLPLKEWHNFIGDPTSADAICDRLFHVAHKLELKGGSMRKKIENID